MDGGRDVSESRQAPTSVTLPGPVELTMAELRTMPYTPELDDLERAGIHVDDWIWNPRWPESYRLRQDVNGGKPTSREVRLYRLILLRSFHRLFEGRCSGCGRFFRLRSLVLDHDHSTGYVRGALCASCNAADELAMPEMTPRQLVAEDGVLVRLYGSIGPWSLPKCCLCECPEHVGLPCEKEDAFGGTTS